MTRCNEIGRVGERVLEGDIETVRLLHIDIVSIRILKALIEPTSPVFLDTALIPFSPHAM